MDGVLSPPAALPELTAAEIELRLPLWTAFSDLFLDTDPVLSHRYIRRTMDESPYTREQLWLILWFEVTPAFSPNLSLVAGEWAGWPEDLVRKLVLRQQSRAPWLKRLLGNLPARRDRAYVEGQWQALLAVTTESLS